MRYKKEEAGLGEFNISLVLDSYEDIFSDFDPRPYAVRALSDDFLSECRKASVDKEEGLELRFILKKERRNTDNENEIKKRLRNHFQKHFKEKQKEIRGIKKEGISWFFMGSIIMVISTFLYERPGWLFEFLFIISQPAGWFTFWEGLGKIFIEARKKTPDYTFYKKMKNAKIIFLNH